MSERLKRRMTGDVAWLIRQSDRSATLLRPQVAGEDSFYGAHEPVEDEIGTVPIEMKALSPRDLAEIGADAAASVLPDSDVREQDILEVDGVRYRVSEVKPQNCFGALTHLDLHLELEKRGVSDE
jgi:hypothetical protein